MSELDQLANIITTILHADNDKLRKEAEDTLLTLRK